MGEKGDGRPTSDLAKQANSNRMTSAATNIPEYDLGSPCKSVRRFVMGGMNAHLFIGRHVSPPELPALQTTPSGFPIPELTRSAARPPKP